MDQANQKNQADQKGRTVEEELLGTGLRVRFYPDPVLKKPAEPVTDFDGELAAFVEELLATMRISDGVGLAAPQVGVLKKIAVVEYEGSSYVLINPRLIEQGGEQEGEEGCLSFPGIYASVKRPEWARIEAQDERGESRVQRVEGFLARAFLHEMDHLEGRLFIDRLSPIKRGMIRGKMKKHPPEPRRAAAAKGDRG